MSSAPERLWRVGPMTTMPEDNWMRSVRVYLVDGEVVQHDGVAAMTPEGVYLHRAGPDRHFFPAMRVVRVEERPYEGWPA